MERTVIIPALNPDEGLREIVERNWELENQIILVDDGSDKKYERLFWELGGRSVLFCIMKRTGERARQSKRL